MGRLYPAIRTGLAHKIKRTDKRQAKWRKQRKKYGYDTTELWSLDSTIAKFILPRLKAFRSFRCGYPGALNSREEWDAILDVMIQGFEIQADDSRWHEYGADNKIDAGIKVFCEWYCALWI